MKYILIVFFFFGLTELSNAQESSVSIGGDVAKPFALTKAIYASMKEVTVKVKQNDGTSHEYKGVSLYDILTKAEAIPNQQLRGKSLMKYILVTAADGYQVVLAIAEVDPAFTDHSVILATTMDGEELPANLGPFRLIVSGDKKPARSVMRVTDIDVQTAKK